MNPYIPKKARITRAEKLTSNTALLRVNSWMWHEPGQFVQVSLLGFGEAPISICSYSKTHIDLLVRGVGNLTNKLVELKKWDQLLVRGPYGKGYPLHSMQGKDLVLVGGGTGVAPLRAVIEYLKANRKKYGKISIFFGFKTIDDLLFKNDFDDWKKKWNFNASLDKGCKEWKGNVCLVTDLVKKAKVSKESVAIVCGPPVMTKFLAPVLNEKGITDDRIFVSLERQMKCGIGKCGKCMTHGKRICLCGPVFTYDKVKESVE